MSIIKANKWQFIDGTLVQAPLQIAQARKTDTNFSTTSTGFVNLTDLTVTMTPRSVNSRFLVELNVYVGCYWWGSNGGYLGCNATWTGGSLGTFLGSGNSCWALQYGADSGNSPYETVQWTDSAIITPGTTNPITFQATIASGNASYALYVNRSYNNLTNGGKSTLTVTEIAG